jgi:hypothetical protein
MSHHWWHSALHVLKHAIESNEGKRVTKAIMDQAKAPGMPAIVAAALPVAAVAGVAYGVYSYFNKE